jgi:predicted Zn-dependent protease
LIQTLVIIFLVVLLLFILPEHLPRLSRRLGKRTGKKIKLAKDLLKSVEEPGGLIAKIEGLAGKRVLKEILSKTPAIEKTKQTETVEKIGSELARYAKRGYIPYRFIVIDDPGLPNACAIPGGSILITQTLLDICSSADEVAGVLSHEIQHVDCSHWTKSNAAAIVLAKIIRLDDVVVSQVAELCKKFIVCGYLQDNEFEADSKGTLLAKKAGFDPRGLRKLLKKLGLMTKDTAAPTEGFSYFSSHPPMPERIRKLRKLTG